MIEDDSDDKVRNQALQQHDTGVIQLYRYELCNQHGTVFEHLLQIDNTI